MILALCCKQKLLKSSGTAAIQTPEKALQYNRHRATAEGGDLPPSLQQGILQDEIAEAHYVQRRLEKRRLLTGELKEYDFSSEVFPRSAK